MRRNAGAAAAGTLTESVHFSSAKESCYDEKYFSLFSQLDAVIDIFAYQPIVLGGALPDEQMALYRKYISQLFYKLMECKRFTQIRIPTAANAEESDLEPEEYIDRMNRAYDIDYEELKETCQKEAERYKEAGQVQIKTRENAVLRLSLQGRDWHIDAGDGDLPCGEIYIAPVEQETNGEVFFAEFYLDGKRHENVTLRVSGGEVVDCDQSELATHFAALPPEEKTVCELGIGLNKNVTDLCGYTVLDEKMAGTFHIAIGANEMFGGKNKAKDHNDFVGRGTIEVIR